MDRPPVWNRRLLRQWRLGRYFFRAQALWRTKAYLRRVVELDDNVTGERSNSIGLAERGDESDPWGFGQNIEQKSVKGFRSWPRAVTR